MATVCRFGPTPRLTISPTTPRARYSPPGVLCGPRAVRTWHVLMGNLSAYTPQRRAEKGGRPFSMTETAAGEIYVGAGFGLYRFHPEAETSDRRFEPIALP